MNEKQQKVMVAEMTHESPQQIHNEAMERLFTPNDDKELESGRQMFLRGLMMSRYSLIVESCDKPYEDIQAIAAKSLFSEMSSTHDIFKRDNKFLMSSLSANETASIFLKKDIDLKNDETLSKNVINTGSVSDKKKKAMIGKFFDLFSDFSYQKSLNNSDSKEHLLPKECSHYLRSRTSEMKDLFVKSFSDTILPNIEMNAVEYSRLPPTVFAYSLSEMLSNNTKSKIPDFQQNIDMVSNFLACTPSGMERKVQNTFSSGKSSQATCISKTLKKFEQVVKKDPEYLMAKETKEYGYNSVLMPAAITLGISAILASNKNYIPAAAADIVGLSLLSTSLGDKEKDFIKSLEKDKERLKPSHDFFKIQCKRAIVPPKKNPEEPSTNTPQEIEHSAIVGTRFFQNILDNNSPALWH